MDDGLTFRFVFADEGQPAPSAAPPAPPEAKPGEAAKTNPKASATATTPPAPRKPAPDTTPTPTPAAPPGSSAPVATEKESPLDRTGDRPRRRPAHGHQTGQSERRSVKAKEPAAEERQSGEAAKLLGELVRHLQQLPGIGRAIASLFHVTEPLVNAYKQIRQIRAEQAKRQERTQGIEPVRREPPKPVRAVVPAAPAPAAAPASVPTAPTPGVSTETPPAAPEVRPPVVHVEAPAAATPPIVPAPRPAPPPLPIPLPPTARAVTPPPVVTPMAEKAEAAPAPPRSAPESEKPAPPEPRDNRAPVQMPPMWTGPNPFERKPAPPAAESEERGPRVIRPFAAPPPEPRQPKERPEPEAVPRPTEPAEKSPAPQAAVVPAPEPASISVTVNAPESRAPAAPSPSVLDREPPETHTYQQAAGYRVAAQPGQQAALEKLIAALGPLPESNRELKQALEPLTALGYTMTELLAAVKEMERAKEERVPGVEGARPAEAAETAAKPEPLEKAPTAGAATKPAAPTPRSVPPATAPAAPRPPDAMAAPSPAPVAATSAVADGAAGASAVASGAAQGAAVAGAATMNPALLIGGIAAVAVIGTAARTISGLAHAAKAADRALQDTAKELRTYNSALAASQANADVRKIMNDVERANFAGRDLAAFTDERAELNRSMDRIYTAIEVGVVRGLVPLMRALNALVEPVAENMETITAFVEGVLKGAAAGMPGFLGKIIEQMIKGNKIKKDEQFKLDAAADIMGIFGGHPRAYDPQGALGGMGGVANPLTPAPIVPGPGVPPGQGIGGI